MKKVILSSLVVAGVLFSGCSVLKQPLPPLTKERVRTGNGVIDFNVNLQKQTNSDISYTGYKSTNRVNRTSLKVCLNET